MNRSVKLFVITLGWVATLVVPTLTVFGILTFVAWMFRPTEHDVGMLMMLTTAFAGLLSGFALAPWLVAGALKKMLAERPEVNRADLMNLLLCWEALLLLLAFWALYVSAPPAIVGPLLASAFVLPPIGAYVCVPKP